MSMNGCCAIDSVCPLKVQKTWLSGYWPFVWLMTSTSRTCVAAGMALTLPQKDAGGSPPGPPPPAELTVQVNEAVPVTPVVSLAVTVTVEVPAAVGVPEISPEDELIDSPAGRPVAV